MTEIKRDIFFILCYENNLTTQCMRYTYLIEDIGIATCAITNNDSRMIYE